MDSLSAFRAACNSFDPFLSFRWSSRIGKWVVDRKALIPGTEIAFLTRRIARLEDAARRAKTARSDSAVNSELHQTVEELASAKEGKRIVFFTKTLDSRTFDALAFSDIRRYGGYSRFADELEKTEAYASSEADRMFRNHMEGTHKEAYEMLNFLDRKRSTELERGERRLEVLLK
jgi:hypothetical protein